MSGCLSLSDTRYVHSYCGTLIGSHDELSNGVIADVVESPLLQLTAENFLELVSQNRAYVAYSDNCNKWASHV